MISTKTIIGVVIIAILIGVLYVTFEKNFFAKSIRGPQASSARELSKENAPLQKNSLIDLPTPEPAPPQITESSDLSNEASNLEMRDYSAFFEKLKDAVGK